MMGLRVKPLQHPATVHLRAAQGWLELGKPLEANEELEWITPQLRSHPDVMEVRWQISANLEKWERALEIATALAKMRPDWPNGWIYRASSLTELNRHLEAHETLSEAATRFPSDEIILYDLACVCCALKRLDEAQTWLGRSLELGGEEIKRRALDDPDLEPIWKQIKAGTPGLK